MELYTSDVWAGSKSNTKHAEKKNAFSVNMHMMQVHYLIILKYVFTLL